MHTARPLLVGSSPCATGRTCALGNSGERPGSATSARPVVAACRSPAGRQRSVPAGLTRRRSAASRRVAGASSHVAEPAGRPGPEAELLLAAAAREPGRSPRDAGREAARVSCPGPAEEGDGFRRGDVAGTFRRGCGAGLAGSLLALLTASRVQAPRWDAGSSRGGGGELSSGPDSAVSRLRVLSGVTESPRTRNLRALDEWLPRPFTALGQNEAVLTAPSRPRQTPHASQIGPDAHGTV